MNATLKFDIECGEKTCQPIAPKANACQFLSIYLAGVCGQFGELEKGEGDLEGWFMRDPECLKRAEENEEKK